MDKPILVPEGREGTCRQIYFRPIAMQKMLMKNRLPRSPISRFLTIAASLACLHASASAAWLDAGQPRIGIEAESERGANGAMHSRSLTLTPGIKWQEGWITVAELIFQVEGEQDQAMGARETRRKGGLRLRKDVYLMPELAGTMRVFVGQASGANERYTYAYLEPGLRYEFDDVELAVGYRVIRAVDASRGHAVNELRLGPSFELSRHDEVEFRWVRGWDALSQRFLSDSWSIEYTRKF